MEIERRVMVIKAINGWKIGITQRFFLWAARYCYRQSYRLEKSYDFTLTQREVEKFDDRLTDRAGDRVS